MRLNTLGSNSESDVTRERRSDFRTAGDRSRRSYSTRFAKLGMGLGGLLGGILSIPIGWYLPFYYDTKSSKIWFGIGFCIGSVVFGLLGAGVDWLIDRVIPPNND